MPALKQRGRAALPHALVMALALVAGGVPRTHAEEIHVVTHDTGGSVIARWHEVTNLRVEGTEVRIEGPCMSSCTMYLGLPNTCVSPSASFGFHGPRSGTTGRSLADTSAARLMASHYPPVLRNWFLREGQYLQGNHVVTLSGHQLIAMGIRRC